MAEMIYLAQPIDQAAKDNSSWAAITSYALKDAGYTVYHPARAWAAMTPDFRVEQVNRLALNRCDVVVAILPKGVPSIGVPMEIEAAHVQGMPVVVLTDVASFSLVGRSGIFTTAEPDEVLPLVEGALAGAGRRPASPPTPPVQGSPLRVAGLEGVLPTRAHDDDAGLDLYTSERTVIPSQQFAYIPTGIRVELPYWGWGLILGRSSSLRGRKLLVVPAVIDTGWRGEIQVAAYNLGREPAVIEEGIRIGQMIIMHNHTRSVTPVSAFDLTPHPRGENGFGSSGS